MSGNQYVEIVRFIRNSNYTKAVTHQDVNPINEHDCTMLIIEYTQNMTTQLAESRAEIERLKHCKKCGKFIDIESITCPSCVDNSPVKKRDNLIEQMREALIKCQEVFLQYAKIHRAKIPEFRPAIFPDPFVEIEAKVKRNLDMADLCAAALAAERGD